MEFFAALFVEHLEEMAIAAGIAIGMAVLGRVLLFIFDKAVIRESDLGHSKTAS